MTTSYADLRRQVEIAKNICETLLRTKRDPSPEQTAAVETGLEAQRELKGLNAAGADVVKWLGSGGQSITDQTRGFIDFEPAGRKAIGAQLITKMTAPIDSYGTKALIVAGTATTDIALSPADPIALGRVATSLASVVPTTKIAGNQAQFFQQNVRTGGAGPVAIGAVKPTTDLGLVRKTVLLEVLATLSSPVNRFDLEDAASLGQFVQSELIYSVGISLESQILVGTGVSPQLAGLTTTSGIQAVAAVAADLLGTLRKGVTALETVGDTGDLVFVMSPATWEACELSRAPLSGTFELSSSPVDRAAQRIWGTPVVLSNATPAGKAVIFAQSAVNLYVDSLGLRTDWSSPGDLWTRNQLQARCEMRCQLAVLRLASVAVITLPA